MHVPRDCELAFSIICPHLPSLSVDFVGVSYTWKMIPDPNKHCSSLDAQWTRAQRKEKKIWRDVGGKKWHLPLVSFVAILLAVHLLFSSLKKTAGWYVVRLSLKALGQKCMDEQVVDLSVWLWICLCLDARWQTRAQKRKMLPLSGGGNPPRTPGDIAKVESETRKQ